MMGVEHRAGIQPAVLARYSACSLGQPSILLGPTKAGIYHSGGDRKTFHADDVVPLGCTRQVQL